MAWSGAQKLIISSSYHHLGTTADNVRGSRITVGFRMIIMGEGERRERMSKGGGYTNGWIEVKVKRVESEKMRQKKVMFCLLATDIARLQIKNKINAFLDLATSIYAKVCISFLDDNGVNFVPGKHNLQMSLNVDKSKKNWLFAKGDTLILILNPEIHTISNSNYFIWRRETFGHLEEGDLISGLYFDMRRFHGANATDLYPPWMNPHMVSRGQQFALEHVTGVVLSAFYGLSMLFAFPQISDILIFTGKQDKIKNVRE
ncbi:hypothetical protein Fcan01_23331 [Folsomia candida]|uniref:Uncharacterized protein n=1 Tax=Folsomia candida TaxID=158441 RepID=A0A226D9C4_FOLCA|nr:hypothetical protein Fcan01_23331 [Folsomia candida]